MKFTTAVTLPEEICVELILLSHEKAKGRKWEREIIMDVGNIKA